MRVLVTGGAGFIGANLCRVLVARGIAVRVLDDLSTGTVANLDGTDVELRIGSILDSGDLVDAVVGADAVVHLAARPSVPRSLEDPIATHRVNVDGTLAVLEACRAVGAGHVVLASSSSVYGSNPVSPKHEQLPVLPLSPYGASKLAGESYALAYQTSFGLPTLALRFFNVFGPLQAAGHAYAAVIPTFLAAALTGEPVPVHGDGSQTRDFTHVDSVCGVLADALERKVTHPSAVNLAFGTQTTLNALIDLISELVGHRVERATLPPRTGDIHTSRADGSVLAGLFPTAAPVPLKAGIATTLAWMQAELAMR
jgi:UDP-glucose 4-epimerase